MGKWDNYCSNPILPVEASQHRCLNCGKKFHGLCSRIKHPRARKLRLTMGNDHLCPSCARIMCRAHVVPSLGSDSPQSCTGSEDNHSSTSSTTNSNDESISPDSKRLLRMANDNPNPLPLIPIIPNARKNQQQSIHSLPTGVEIMNMSANDGAKCNFSKQSKCRYKDTDIVACTKCENAVHVQCFLNLILGKHSKVSYFKSLSFIYFLMLLIIIILFQFFDRNYLYIII
jgi:hypothetical protein